MWRDFRLLNVRIKLRPFFYVQTLQVHIMELTADNRDKEIHPSELILALTKSNLVRVFYHACIS